MADIIRDDILTIRYHMSMEKPVLLENFNWFSKTVQGD